MKLFEITRGEQVMDFADYIDRVANISKDLSQQYEEIGSALLAADFEYDDTLFHKVLNEGGLFEFTFPSMRQVIRLERDFIGCRYYVFKKNVKYEFFRQMSSEAILSMTVPMLFDFMKTSARTDETI
jgi:hypothetical protein